MPFYPLKQDKDFLSPRYTLEVLKSFSIGFAYLIAVIIFVSLVFLINLGLVNRFSSGDSQGWGALIVPLVAIFPLGAALPFILKSSLKGFFKGSLLSGFGFIFLVVVCFIGFVICLYKLFLQLNLNENPLISCFGLWLFTSLIIGAVGTSFVEENKFKLIFLGSFILTGLFVFIPMLKVLKQVADSKVVISFEYNDSFDPHEYHIYQFPDFKFVPNKSLDGYHLLQLALNEKQVRYIPYDFVIKNGKFCEHCGAPYEKITVELELTLPELSPREFFATPEENRVAIRERLKSNK